ncbi:unnamed protein product, partial [Ixodes persulcatus]
FLIHARRKHKVQHNISKRPCGFLNLAVSIETGQFACKAKFAYRVPTLFLIGRKQLRSFESRDISRHGYLAPRAKLRDKVYHSSYAIPLSSLSSRRRYKKTRHCRPDAIKGHDTFIRPSTTRIKL